MEAHPTSSSSKVKVEYHDPSNVFPHIAAEIEAQLPLRGLNWSSAGRPMRSIDSLYVSLEPASDVSATVDIDRLAPENQVAESRAQGTSNWKRDSDSTAMQKGRRHQIPGLRQTPYLKLLLIRCDDPDIYKTSSRKDVREWIKTHTPPSQKSNKGSSQENHDAYEWLILHVVLPDIDRKVTWPHRNSIKILGYLKDDFNSSSKSAIDRVAQVPSVRFSASSESRASIHDPTFSKQESDAWTSFISSLKQLILASFDQRVRQYEDDIKEKRAQRSLPGWNFCTYFVLKEGLARGFESVGLVDDALSGYDELQAELESAVRSKYDAADRFQDTTIFRERTPEVEELFKETMAIEDSQIFSLFTSQTIDPTKKPYRDLILSSDISVFDFRTYVFAREISLLRRLSFVNKSEQGSRTSIEPRFLCEICHRSSSFLATAGKALRDDVLSTLAAHFGLRHADARDSDTLATKFVSAWTYSIVTNVMEAIQVGKEITPTGLNSAQTHSSALDEASNQTQASSSSSTYINSLLASRKARLILTARKALQQIASCYGWLSGWQAMAAAPVDMLKHGSELSQSPAEAADAQPSHGHSNPALKSLKDAVSSQHSYNASYISLSYRALENHQVAGDLKSARLVQIDVAIEAFNHRNPVAAASMLKKAIGNENHPRWSCINVPALAVLSFCYKQIGNNREHVRLGLKLISSSTRLLAFKPIPILHRYSSTDELLRYFIETSENLTEQIMVPLRDLVEDVDINPYIEHSDAHDGFYVLVNLKSQSLASCKIDKITLQLSRTIDQQTVALESQGTSSIIPKEGGLFVRLFSSAVLLGSFKPALLSVRTGKITFASEIRSEYPLHEVRLNSVRDLLNSQPEVHVWMPPRSANLTAKIFEKVDLERNKSVIITIYTSQNIICGAQLRLRAATAGLRLHTSQATVTSGSCVITGSSEPGTLQMEGLRQSDSIRVAVPFQTEFEVKDIVLRSELEYRTASGSFKIGRIDSLSVVLALGVNVQEVFKHRTLFSRFSVSSSTVVPLEMLDYSLEGFGFYSASCLSRSKPVFPIFPRQPASLIYKIRPSVEHSYSTGAPNRLRLKIAYRCLDEEVLAAVRDSLSSALTRTSIESFSRVILSNVEFICAKFFKRQDLEAMALLRKVHIAPYTESGWDTALKYLKRPTREKISAWLQEWHAANEFIPLLRESSGNLTRTISIPVDVPPMYIVHEAKLILNQLRPGQDWHVGDTIPAKLLIKFSFTWAQIKTDIERKHSFSYELEANLDNWIVGGQRKGSFRLAEGESTKFPVVLLPQRTGYLMLPTLDIRLIDPEAETHPGQCEVYYRSQADMIPVTPGVTTATLGINVTGERKSWLIDAA